MDLENLQYPIGRFQRTGEYGPENRGEWLQTIADTPDHVRRVVNGLTDEQLDAAESLAREIIEEAVVHARAAPTPGLEEAYAHVFTD